MVNAEVGECWIVFALGRLVAGVGVYFCWGFFLCYFFPPSAALEGCWDSTEH